MKKLFIVLAVLALSACDASTKEKTNDFIMPKGMEDCQVYRMSDGNTTMNVVVCKGATTSTNYRVGKNIHGTTVYTEE